MQFCRSRNGGRRCTRELGHRGLHRHRAIMWTDAAADAARCPGSGAPGTPATTLSNGFPYGRALCGVCLGFVALDPDGRLEGHDTGSPASDVDRADWFNTHGWTGDAAGGDVRSGG